MRILRGWPHGSITPPLSTRRGLGAESRLAIEVRRPGPELDCNEGAKMESAKYVSGSATAENTTDASVARMGSTVEGAYHDCVTSGRGALPRIA